MFEIPEHVVAFLREYIDSVDQLEILLLLKSKSGSECTAEDISRALSTPTESVISRLAYFQAVGLADMKPGPVPQYQYRPKSDDLQQAVNDLGEAYAQYRVRLINLIYSKPIDKIRTFADAFKFRKEDS